MSDGADLRLARAIEKHAPTYVTRARSRSLVATALQELWPLPFLGLAAYFAGDLPTGYSRQGAWPFYFVVVAMIWWKGRVAGAVTIVAALFYEIWLGLPPGRFIVNATTLSALLILRGRCGLAP